MEIRRENFVSNRQFLESARNLDIKPIEGFYELIDNSFDADSMNIRVHIEKKENNNLRFFIIDDGRGIPSGFTDKEGNWRQGIPYVLAYGGRIPHPGRKNLQIGKFGVGLSQTASCLSSRTEVYTKTRNDDEWRFGYYDFSELENSDDLELEKEISKHPPLIDVPNTGTIIILDNVDRARRKARPIYLVKELESSLGRIYRKFLGDGRKITITYAKDGKIDERVVKISDPLHQAPQSIEVQTFGTSTEYGTVTIKFDENNSIGYIPSYRTGNPAEIKIRLIRLEMENIRRKLGMPLSGAGRKSIKGVNPLSGWGINTEGQGFSIIRNGREIRSSETLGLFTRVNTLNYFRGEVEFDPELDSLFRIQTNKSRFSITNRLRDMISDRCMATIKQIEKDNIKAANANKVKNQKLTPPSSEKVASTLFDNPNFKMREMSKSAKEDAEKEISKRVDLLINKAIREGDSEIDEARTMLENAMKFGDDKRVEIAKLALQNAENEANLRVQSIRDRFAFSSPCRKFYGKVGNGDIYSIEDLDTEVWVTINTESPFFKSLYERATQNSEMESLLDLMIFSIAHSEHLHGHSDKMLEFWNHARNRVSRNAYTFVSRMSLTEDSDTEVIL